MTLTRLCWPPYDRRALEQAIHQLARCIYLCDIEVSGRFAPKYLRQRVRFVSNKRQKR